MSRWVHAYADAEATLMLVSQHAAVDRAVERAKAATTRMRATIRASLEDHPPRIMIVEDEEPAARAIERVLHDAYPDATVEHFGAAEYALQPALQEPYDLLIVDVCLPGANGLDLVARVRRERAVPILLISGVLDEPTLRACASHGASATLQKGAGAGELRDTVRRLLPDMLTVGA